MPYRQFVIPHLFFGQGALESLTTIPFRRALLVTDAGVRSVGLVDRVTGLLRSAGREIAVFDRVEPNPSKDTVLRIFTQAREFKPDVFIGLGGGSSIDAGKGAWIFYEHPDLSTIPLYDVRRELPKRTLRNKAKYIAISTTSGTGAEATPNTVITDRQAKPIAEKVGIYSLQMIPDFAIVDAELAASMPPAVTANTGFDALIHAIECWVLYTPPTDMIDSLAIGAAKTIWEWLPRAVSNGKDMTAREKMHLAALQAGIAFGNGRVGIVHVLSHELSAIFDIPHGRANAFMLCPVFSFLFPSHRTRLVSLAEELGFNGRGDRAKVANLLAGLNKLKQEIGIPLKMKEAGINSANFKKELKGLGQSYALALENRAPGSSAAERRAGGWALTAADAEMLFTHAWNGTTLELK
jgi:alcohol dehydrogenase